MCIAAATVAYFFGFYLPRAHDSEVAEQRRRADLANARRCDADGRKFYANFVKDHAPGRALPGWEIDWGEPEIHYSKKAETCLVNIPSIQRLVEPSYLRAVTPSIHRNQVSDVYRDHAILYGWFERKPEGGETLIDTIEPGVPNYTSEKYFAEKDKLLSQ